MSRSSRDFLAIIGIAVASAMIAGFSVFGFPDFDLPVIFDGQVDVETETRVEPTEPTATEPTEPTATVPTEHASIVSTGLSFEAYQEAMGQKESMTAYQWAAWLEDLVGDSLEWEGRVVDVLSSGTVTMALSREPTFLRHALLYFNNSHKNELLNLRKGELIRVRCKFREEFLGPVLEDCELL